MIVLNQWQNWFYFLCLGKVQQNQMQRFVTNYRDSGQNTFCGVIAADIVQLDKTKLENNYAKVVGCHYFTFKFSFSCC